MRRTYSGSIFLTVFLLIVAAGNLFADSPVTLQQPTGSYFLASPAYTWTEDEAGRVSYQVYVTDSVGTVVTNANYTAASICASGACSVVPGTPLNLGASYCWNVRGKLGSGSLDDWSPALCFTVTRPSVTAPAGLITTVSPSYSWNAFAGATGYQVYVVDGSGSVVINERHTAAELSCGSGELTCTFTPGVNLTDTARYSWNLRGYNGGGIGPWSDAKAFIVNTAGLPDKPDTSASTPSGIITDTTPTFTWPDTGDALSYQVHVVASSGVVAIDETGAASALCSGGSCSYIPGSPLTDLTTYTWNVRGLNIAGPGLWSDTVGFVVNSGGIPEAPTPVSPGNSDYPATVTVAKDRPVYSWNAMSIATMYQIYIADMTGGGEIMLLDQVLTAAQAGCGSGEPVCSYTPSVQLTMGRDISWSLRAFNNTGEGPWGGPRLFKVTKPTLISPTGNITSQSPTFSWDAIQGSSSYDLKVFNASGTEVHGATYTAGDAGCSSVPGTCSVTPVLTLPDGAAYTWNVQGVNTAGGGPWSDAAAFVVNTSGLPEKPVTSAPSGTIESTQPAFTWTDTGDATGYQINVTNSSGGVAVNETASAASLCSGGNCSFTPSSPLSDQTRYNWAVRGQNIAGTGPWSDVKSFAINSSGELGVPVVIGPSGTISDTTPTFSWNELSGAAQYQLYVTTIAGTLVRNTLYTVGSGGLACESAVCSVTPGDELTDGTTYNWSVRGKNSFSTGSWSAGTGFTVLTTLPPDAPTQSAPAGSITDTTPTYTWTAVSGVTHYQLYMADVSNYPPDLVWHNLYLTAADAGCGSGEPTCSYTPEPAGGGLPLKDGYSWSIRSRNIAGFSDWAGPMLFAVE